MKNLKFIIGYKIYDTDTSKVLFKIETSTGAGGKDETTFYKSAKGNYFKVTESSSFRNALEDGSNVVANATNEEEIKATLEKRNMILEFERIFGTLEIG